MSIVKIEIETAIRQVSWATAQVGQKSLQTIEINFDKKEITSSVKTGKTTIPLPSIGIPFIYFDSHSLSLKRGSIPVGGDVNLKSIRDSFSISRKIFSSQTASFSVIGETASGVHFMPNINYQFNIKVNESARFISISGSHDGYPSYNIRADKKIVYDCTQGWVGELAGNSDVKVTKTNISF